MSFSEKVIMNGTTWASILSSVRNQTGKSAALVAGQVPAQIDSIQKTVEYLYIDGTQATLDENDIVIFTNSGGGSGITPTGTLSISTNGTYNVTNYASANVSVPTGTARTSADLTASGAIVTVPAGLYSEQATKSVASGTEGTPVATKGAVSNHAVSVTPSVTNINGYIAGGTKTGTAVSVSASELVSGSETKTVNGTYDVTNLAELVVNVPQSGSAATLITKNITSNGTYDAEDDSADGYSSVTVNVPTGGFTADEIATKAITSISLIGTRIGSFAFYAQPITTINAPNVTTIEANAFQYCRQLRTCIFPELTTISGTSAFMYAGASSFSVTNGILVFPKLALGKVAKTFDRGYFLAIDIGPYTERLHNDTFYRNVEGQTVGNLILRKADAVVVAATTDAIRGLRNVYIPDALYQHLGDGTALDYQAATNWSTRYNAGYLTFYNIKGSVYENKYADGTTIPTS